MLGGLARRCYDRWRWVLAVWVVALAVAVPSAMAFGGRSVTNFDVPDSEAAAAIATLRSRFPEAFGDRVDLVVRADVGLRSPPAQRRLYRVLGAARSPDDLRPWLGADLTGAEVRYLMEQEWAQTEDDVLWRRSKLGLRFSPEERERMEAAGLTLTCALLEGEEE